MSGEHGDRKSAGEATGNGNCPDLQLHGYHRLTFCALALSQSSSLRLGMTKSQRWLHCLAADAGLSPREEVRVMGKAHQ